MEEGRKVCSECGTPLVIIKGAPIIRDGKIIHISSFGCSNKKDKCPMEGIEIDRKENELETF